MDRPDLPTTASNSWSRHGRQDTGQQPRPPLVGSGRQDLTRDQGPDELGPAPLPGSGCAEKGTSGRT